MRITTGLYKGRVLDVPPGKNIRPTGDRMRQALFNILLGYDLPAGAVVLDAFCGTGILGLEALSRGATVVTFMDVDVAACAANIARLGVRDKTNLLRRDATRPGIAQGAPAGLVFLDPPYERNLMIPALTALAENGWLAPAAIVVAETETGHPDDRPAGFEILERRRYGAASLWLCRYTG